MINLCCNRLIVKYSTVHIQLILICSYPKFLIIIDIDSKSPGHQLLSHENRSFAWNQFLVNCPINKVFASEGILKVMDILIQWFPKGIHWTPIEHFQGVYGGFRDVQGRYGKEHKIGVCVNTLFAITPLKKMFTLHVMKILQIRINFEILSFFTDIPVLHLDTSLVRTRLSIQFTVYYDIGKKPFKMSMNMFGILRGFTTSPVLETTVPIYSLCIWIINDLYLDLLPLAKEPRGVSSDHSSPLHLLNQHRIFIHLTVELFPVDGGDVDGLTWVREFGAGGGTVVWGGAFQHTNK